MDREPFDFNYGLSNFNFQSNQYCFLLSGSRAHAPKLRVRLLSPAHPAAQRSIQQQVTARHKQYFVKRDGLNLRSVKSKSVTKRVDKNKAVSEMVQIVAAERVSSKSSSKLMEKSSIKRKVPSIHDITEDFKRLRGGNQSQSVRTLSGFLILNVSCLNRLGYKFICHGIL